MIALLLFLSFFQFSQGLHFLLLFYEPLTNPGWYVAYYAGVVTALGHTYELQDTSTWNGNPGTADAILIGGEDYSYAPNAQALQNLIAEMSAGNVGLVIPEWTIWENATGISDVAPVVSTGTSYGASITWPAPAIGVLAIEVMFRNIIGTFPQVFDSQGLLELRAQPGSTVLLSSTSPPGLPLLVTRTFNSSSDKCVVYINHCPCDPDTVNDASEASYQMMALVVQALEYAGGMKSVAPSTTTADGSASATSAASLLDYSGILTNSLATLMLLRLGVAN